MIQKLSRRGRTVAITFGCSGPSAVRWFTKDLPCYIWTASRSGRVFHRTPEHFAGTEKQRTKLIRSSARGWPAGAEEAWVEVRPVGWSDADWDTAEKPIEMSDLPPAV